MSSDNRISNKNKKMDRSKNVGIPNSIFKIYSEIVDKWKKYMQNKDE